MSPKEPKSGNDDRFSGIQRANPTQDRASARIHCQHAPGIPMAEGIKWRFQQRTSKVRSAHKLDPIRAFEYAMALLTCANTVA
jgi:hypothetical protein